MSSTPRKVSWTTNNNYSVEQGMKLLENLIMAEFTSGDMEIYKDKIILRDAVLEYSKSIKKTNGEEIWFESGQYFAEIVFQNGAVGRVFNVTIKSYKDHKYGLCTEEMIEDEEACGECSVNGPKPEIETQTFIIMPRIFVC